MVKATPKATNPYIKGLWQSFMVAYIALLPSFYMIFSADNRFALQWSPVKHAGILMALVIYGLSLYLAFLLLKKLFAQNTPVWSAVKAGATMLVWFLLIRTMLSIYIKSRVGIELEGMDMELPASVTLLNSKITKLCLYAGLPVALLLIFKLKFTNFTQGLLKLFSPLLILIVLFPLTYVDTRESLSNIDPGFLGKEQKANSPNVYMFLFDEWSYVRSFEDGRVRDNLPNLKKWVDTSDSYNQAYSLAEQTMFSIPRYIFQNDPGFRTRDNESIRDDITHMRKINANSFFDIAPDGWFKTAIGFWLKYDRLLGDKIDYAFSTSGSTTGSELSAWAECRRHLARQLSFLSRFGIKASAIETDFVKDVMAYSTDVVDGKSFDIVNNIHVPTFGFFHYCIPHHPFVYDRNGRRDDITDHSIHVQSPENYLHNLEYMDTVLGQIEKRLKAAGKYENSLIILCSDHTWREDPDYEHLRHTQTEYFTTEVLRHVPLIIKHPNQREPRQINDKITLDLMQNILKDYFDEH